MMLIFILLIYIVVSRFCGFGLKLLFLPYKVTILI
nr:MAG TPA: hypothetical protein [Caudoviricetes sp.]